MNPPTICEQNPTYKEHLYQPGDVVSIFRDTVAEYDQFPVLHRGQSKELRKVSPTLAIGKFIPTVYSHKANRAGEIPGTEKVRLQISGYFWNMLHSNNVPTCYLAFNDEHFLVRIEEIPPIEVIVKYAFVGTPAHIYHGILETPSRIKGGPLVKGEMHEPYVRFDWRNPQTNEKGERMRDETLPLPLANHFINVANAGVQARRISDIVQFALSNYGLELLDICLFLDKTGQIFCGEISPDNFRVKQGDTDYDKDMWRKGETPEQILERWTALRDILITPK